MEVQSWEEFRALRGRVFVESKEDALRAAREWRGRPCTKWTDGPRMESGAVGAAVAFWRYGGWVRRGTYLGKNKEVFDAEVLRSCGQSDSWTKGARAEGNTPSSRTHRRR